MVQSTQYFYQKICKGFINWGRIAKPGKSKKFDWECTIHRPGMQHRKKWVCVIDLQNEVFPEVKRR